MKTIWSDDKPEERQKCNRPTCEGYWQELRGAGGKRGWLWTCTKNCCPSTPTPLS